MSCLDLVVLISKIEWPLLWTSLFVLFTGIFALYLWDPKRGWGVNATNYGILFYGIGFTLMGLYWLFQFLKELF
jgi:hypothetical protein